MQIVIKQENFVEYLVEMFPEAKCELNFNTNFELLVAVILSAQCTDKRVNLVTKELFKTHNTPEHFAKISQGELEQKIKSCGFYHNKAKFIKQCAESLIEKHNGIVPNNFDELCKLSGVGRKTANVVCAVAFNENRIAVDTHVLRVSNRLGFTKSKNPDICERDLVKLFKTNLDKLHYRMVLFGRYHCKAIKPECEMCKLKEFCKYFKEKNKK